MIGLWKKIWKIKKLRGKLHNSNCAHTHKKSVAQKQTNKKNLYDQMANHAIIYIFFLNHLIVLWEVLAATSLRIPLYIYSLNTQSHIEMKDTCITDFNMTLYNKNNM